MVGLYARLALFVGIPGLVLLADRRRRTRTRSEQEDEAVRIAREGSGEGPGSHEPVAPSLPNTFIGPTGGL
jgi:hypothetical protein